jgi:hypothetical protein
MEHVYGCGGSWTLHELISLDLDISKMSKAVRAILCEPVNTIAS